MDSILSFGTVRGGDGFFAGRNYLFNDGQYVEGFKE